MICFFLVVGSVASDPGANVVVGILTILIVLMHVTCRVAQE
jgi:hypothetical protein